MTVTRPFSRAFICAAIFCGYAVPYAWMDEHGRTWPILRAVVGALVAAVIVGTVAVRFGWPVRWWQFAVAVLLAQVLVACVLEFGARQARPNKSLQLKTAPHSVPEVTAVRERTMRSTVAPRRLWLSLGRSRRRAYAL